VEEVVCPLQSDKASVTLTFGENLHEHKRGPQQQ
jgi:hypothetical protein